MQSHDPIARLRAQSESLKERAIAAGDCIDHQELLHLLSASDDLIMLAKLAIDKATDVGRRARLTVDLSIQ